MYADEQLTKRNKLASFVVDSGFIWSALSLLHSLSLSLSHDQEAEHRLLTVDELGLGDVLQYEEEEEDNGLPPSTFREGSLQYEQYETCVHMYGPYFTYTAMCSIPKLSV